MRPGLRYHLSRYRSGQLSPTYVRAAVTRKARGLLGRVAAEARAHLLGTAIGEQALRSALRPEVGGFQEILQGEGPLDTSAFFLDSKDRDRLVARIRTERPESIRSTIGAAEAICAHRFDLLGSGPTALGPEIDWHRDFKSAYRWPPRTYYRRVRYGHVPGADVKVPWELSRFQHLPTLGKAYWLTGEPRYAVEFVAELTQWIAHNPPQFGVNWVTTMEVGIRAFNWLWGYAFFEPAPQLTPNVRWEFTRALLAHARHILDNLDRATDGRTSNHYLANLLGLLGLGLICPGFREAESWRRFALEEIFREMERQVHPDGGDYESSIPYHRLVTEMFLAAALLCRKNGIDAPESFRLRLERMLEFTLWYTKPNGLAPQVGDADDGRLHILADYGSWDPRDHRHLLSTGGTYLGRDDWRAAAGASSEEAIWLCGEGRALDPRLAASSPGSRAFPDSGIYLMREGGLYLLIANGPVGTRGIGNHKHNDLLSFELHADGQDLMVDPGSFLYTPDPASRNRFRSTAAHNTVMVDGQEQNRFGEGNLFWLHVDATPRCLAWETRPDVDVFMGEHDGYARLADPVLHRREIHLRKAARRIEVIDRLQGTGRHVLTWNFTLASGVALRPAGEGRWELAGASARALLALERMEARTGREPLRSEVVETFVSPRYGVGEKTIALRWHLTSSLPLECRFQIEVG